jgi:hypothetical protein
MSWTKKRESSVPTTLDLTCVMLGMKGSIRPLPAVRRSGRGPRNEPRPPLLRTTDTRGRSLAQPFGRSSSSTMIGGATVMASAYDRKRWRRVSRSEEKLVPLSRDTDVIEFTDDRERPGRKVVSAIPSSPSTLAPHRMHGSIERRQLDGSASTVDSMWRQRMIICTLSMRFARRMKLAARYRVVAHVQRPTGIVSQVYGRTTVVDVVWSMWARCSSDRERTSADHADRQRRDLDSSGSASVTQGKPASLRRNRTRRM